MRFFGLFAPPRARAHAFADFSTPILNPSAAAVLRVVAQEAGNHTGKTDQRKGNGNHQDYIPVGAEALSLLVTNVRGSDRKYSHMRNRAKGEKP